VLKIERPERGDDLRHYPFPFGAASVNFALLNRGKRSIAIDLKAPDATAQLTKLIQRADVLVEQFRPGVMDRLGLGYDAGRGAQPAADLLRDHGLRPDRATRRRRGPRPQLYRRHRAAGAVGRTGRRADRAAALIADIGGGALPAVINILLALRRREATGAGCKLDVAMCDSLFAFEYWALGQGEAQGAWPKPGGELVSGGSPRYQIYRTADGRFVAAAPIEQKFWDNFCGLIGLATEWRDDARDPQGTLRAVAALIARETADYWRGRFTGQDCCCHHRPDGRRGAAGSAFPGAPAVRPRGGRWRAQDQRAAAAARSAAAAPRARARLSGARRRQRAARLMAPPPITRQLAAFLAAARPDDVPESVRHEAKRSLLNFFASALSGCVDSAIGHALRVLGPLSGPRVATVIGHDERLDFSARRS